MYKRQGVEAGYLEDAVAAYNAQSDKYYVEALSVPDSQKIMVAIQSGDGPDITDDFTNNIGAYASKGIMLPPVSYTHLDVYKRQGNACGHPRPGCG